MHRFALALGALLLAAAAPSGAQNERHPYTLPHVLRYATGEDIVGLNPHLNQQLVLQYMARMTMAYLLRYDARNQLTPELATVVPSTANGGISRDGKTFTYHLRRDAKWSDGAAFTSADVKFSAEAVLNPRNNEATRDGWDKIVRIDTPDAATVVFHLRAVDSTLLATFFSSAGGVCLLPRHLLGGLPEINDAPYNALPVGIGPFKYASWKRADSVELVPDPLYFRGPPKLERVVFKVIPDRNTVLTQLTTHEIDLWLPVPAAFADRVAGIAGIDVFKHPGYGYNHIDFNVTHGALRDPVVRRALRLAVDRSTIWTKIRHRIGVLQDGVIAPSHPFFDPAIARVPFDIGQANALLDRAGYRRGADGVRARDGVRLSFDYATGAGTPDTDQIIELIRSWWQQIGVEFSVRRYPASMFFAPGPSGILYGGHFDVTNFAWGVAPNGDIFGLFACKFVPPNGQNIVRYCNPSIDRDLAVFQGSFDPAVQGRAVRAAQETIARDVPTIVMDSREDIFAYNSDLRNFHPNVVTPFDDARDLDI